LKATLVGTNLVHTLGFYAGINQTFLAALRKSAAHCPESAVFAITDQYSRKVFNDLYFKRTKANPRTAALLCQELFDPY